MGHHYIGWAYGTGVGSFPWLSSREIGLFSWPSLKKLGLFLAELRGVGFHRRCFYPFNMDLLLINCGTPDLVFLYYNCLFCHLNNYVAGLYLYLPMCCEALSVPLLLSYLSHCHWLIPLPVRSIHAYHQYMYLVIWCLNVRLLFFQIVLQCNTGDCSTPSDMAGKVISYLEEKGYLQA